MNWSNKRYVIGAQVVFVLVIVGAGLSSLAFWMLSNALASADAIKLSVFNTGLLILLFYAQTYFVNRYIETQRYKLFFVASFATFVGITLIRIALSTLIIRNYIANDVAVFFGPVFRLMGFITGTSFIVTIIAVAYQLLKNRYVAEKRNLALINEQQAAQLQFLKAQINPHFLFNALNNLYSLVVTKSNDAPKFLLKLSDLLRYVTYESQASSVLLEKEVLHISKFIDLFQMRSEAPLSITLETEGDLAGQSIEPMILIPLVENCFKHCDFETNPEAFVKIKVAVSKGSVIFTTHNSFDKADEQKDTVGGVGLANIRHRLSLRYPQRHTFEFEEKGGVFNVFLKIQTNHNNQTHPSQSVIYENLQSSTR